MSLTSDSGACSVSSSDACARDGWDPEEDGEEEDDEEEFELEADDGSGGQAFIAGAGARIDDGIEFVNDAAIVAAAAAAAAAAAGCGHQRRRGTGAGARQGAGRQSSRPGGAGGSRSYSHHRERIRRERFIELYGKLQLAIPNLLVCKRATHRKILTETAAYLASTIAQIKARRRVSKLRALLAQLEADAAYMRRLSGVQRHRQSQIPGQLRHQQHQPLQPQFGSSVHCSAGSVQRVQQLTPDESPTVLAIGDCFLIG